MVSRYRRLEGLEGRLVLRPAKPHGCIGHRYAFSNLPLPCNRLKGCSKESHASQRIDLCAIDSMRVGMRSLISDPGKHLFGIHRQTPLTH